MRPGPIGYIGPLVCNQFPPLTPPKCLGLHQFWACVKTPFVTLIPLSFPPLHLLSGFVTRSTQSVFEFSLLAFLVLRPSRHMLG
jgi:hypothetical protein